LYHGFGLLNNEVTINYYVPTHYHNFAENAPESWHHYEGEFAMGIKSGFGTLYMTNGDKFSGCFAKGIIEGYGTFTQGTG
jgi:hypothetical protein